MHCLFVLIVSAPSFFIGRGGCFLDYIINLIFNTMKNTKNNCVNTNSNFYLDNWEKRMDNAHLKAICIAYFIYITIAPLPIYLILLTHNNWFAIGFILSLPLAFSLAYKCYKFIYNKLYIEQ